MFFILLSLWLKFLEITFISPGKGATNIDNDAFDDLDEVLGAMGIKAKVRTEKKM